MEHIYVLLSDEDDYSWEDIVIFLTLTDAINASRAFPTWRVEIFENHYNNYVPTYSYYKKGILIMQTIPSLEFSEEKSDVIESTVIHDADETQLLPESSSTSFFNIFYNCFSKT
jgi:hypothetical protein